MSITLKQFRKENKENLKGKKIYLCEHLKSGVIDNVDINLWIGGNSRLLLCPVCMKVHTQTVWEFMIRSVLMIIGVHKDIEYSKWLSEAGKEK